MRDKKRIEGTKLSMLKNLNNFAKSCFSDFFSISLHRSSEIGNCTIGKLSLKQDADGEGYSSPIVVYLSLTNKKIKIMIIRGKNVGRKCKALTEEQLALYDQAKEQGWFEKLEKENVRLAIGRNVAGLLDDLRKIFPDNYVGKEKFGKKWVYTIFRGDKEWNKMMNQPLRFENPKTELKNYLKELR